MISFREFLNEAMSREFIPVVQNKDKTWQVDDSYSGDSFVLDKNEMHQLKQKKVRFMYDSALFGRTDKFVYINQHPKWEGWMVNVKDI